MSDDRAPRKQEKDFTKEVEELEVEARKLAQDGELQQALDKISGLEKQTRNAADLQSTSALLCLAAELAFRSPPSPHFDLLITSLQTYSKKHGQIKEAVTRMVVQAMEFLDEIAGKPKGDQSKEWMATAVPEGGEKIKRWLELLNTLRDITEGKIYLELQRARLTKQLSDYHETRAASAPHKTESGEETSFKPSSKPVILPNGEEEEKPQRPDPVTRKDHLDVAADLLSDIQVETYSSMDRREKTEFILEQMRLEAQRGQWSRVRVGGRKVNRKYLREAGNSDIKLRYWDLMIRLALDDESYLDACKAWQEVWDTDAVKSDDEKNKQAIENIIIYIVLAPYENEQNDMLHKLYANTDLQKCVVHYELLKCFVTQELMRWPGIETLYGPTLRQSSVFALGQEDGEKRWKALHDRVIEHNIRVIAKYYTQITLTRLTELLDLTPDVAERTLCKLVTEKVVYAKIDRPAGIVDFSKRTNADEVLNAWSNDLGKMLGLIEKTSHLINKEYAIHAAKVAASS